MSGVRKRETLSRMTEVSELVSRCVKPSQTTKDYIRAEGDFHKEIYS